jgi:Cu/Ag efflux protein CusF
MDEERMDEGGQAMQRAISIIGALVLLAATATAVAAAGDVTGTVTHVDPRSNIVHFTDGRIVYLEPGAVFMVNGRQVTIDQIRPGMRVAVSGARDTQGRPLAAAPAPVFHVPIDATGTVARFDLQTDTLTLQDGRMLKLGAQSSVWQQEQRAAIQPGERIFVRNAQPTATGRRGTPWPCRASGWAPW